MSIKNFNYYSKYYDLFYKDKNYEKEAKFISDLIKIYKKVKNKYTILEFGSGTGQHANFLVKDGYKVHGIEKSSGMIKKIKKIPGFTCQKGDITNINVKNKFDIVLSLFCVISYQTTNKKVKSVFSNAANHLKKNGLFIFDMWYTPAVYNLRPTVKIKEIKKNNIFIKRVANPVMISSKSAVNVKYSFFLKDLKLNSTKLFKENHMMRHFSLLEIDLLAEMYGFKRLKSLELLSKKKPSNNTWSITIVLKKING
jgi:SAM-dependent methyltransferase